MVVVEPPLASGWRESCQVKIADPKELGRWASVFGVSEAQLAEAVRTVGQRAFDIGLHLARHGYGLSPAGAGEERD
jgi:hypothetical protein